MQVVCATASKRSVRRAGTAASHSASSSALPSTTLRLLRLAAHPTAVAAAFRQLVLHAPRRTVDSRREMERLDAEFHFDAVCAVCAPYRTAFALETAQIGGKKLLWQLDPYASNKDYTAPGGYAREGQLLQTIDTAFITPQALPDYEGGPLSSWRGKVQVLGFPVLLPGGPVPAHEGVRCVFCGSLYQGTCTKDKP